MNEKTLQRLQTERNIWLATNRADGRPHLVPVWFVWWNGRFYLGIQSGSVKAHNLARNPKVSLALEDGVRVVICEGTAVNVPSPLDPQLNQLFQAKYNWNLATDNDYDLLIQITPDKWLTWTGGDAEGETGK